MDQRRSELEALAGSIKDRCREIERVEARVRSLQDSVRDLEEEARRLREIQASEAAHMCTLALTVATRPEPSFPSEPPVASMDAMSRSVSSPSGEDDGGTPEPAASPSRQPRSNSSSRWRRFWRQRASRFNRALQGAETMGAAPRLPASRVELEGVHRLGIPSLVTMSEAKVEAILRGRARGIRTRLDLGFRHLSPRVRRFSVIRPASVPFRADPGGNAPRGFAPAVRELAHRSISKMGRPLNRNEIVDLVSRSGMPLPKNNLKQKVSKILLEDPDLVNVRGAGYTIRVRQNP